MKITGKNIGKKFGKNWIFRNQDFEFSSGDVVAITGKNGAGKSTLLQIIAGYLTPSEGGVLIDDKGIDDSMDQISFIGPYTEIIEEFTLREFLNFHSEFKIPTCTIEEMAQSASLPLDKIIGEFSTGMKQRTKLITVFFFDADLIFMDEPTSNLDSEGFDWWSNQIKMLESKLIFIASNDLNEIKSCSKQLSL